MARGSQRRGRKKTREGAVPRRSGGLSPGAAHVDGAAPEQPEDLGQLVEQLRTTEGRELALASIIGRIRHGYLTRDEVSALTLEKHCILGIGALRERREVPEALADATAALAEMKQAIAGKSGGSLRASAAVTPRIVEANELTRDAEGQAVTPRDGGPYQS